MKEFIGKYKAKKDIQCRIQNKVFTLTKGSIVIVKQFERQKILIDMLDDCIDWFDFSIINNFDKC